MPTENDKKPYDLLLEDNKKMREELNDMQTKLNEMYEFNKALLNREGSRTIDDSSKISKAKFDKFMEE